MPASRTNAAVPSVPVRFPAYTHNPPSAMNAPARTTSAKVAAIGAVAFATPTSRTRRAISLGA